MLEVFRRSSTNIHQYIKPLPYALMEQVAVAARESSRKAKRELERRMQEVREKLKAYRAKNVSDISM